MSGSMLYTALQWCAHSQNAVKLHVSCVVQTPVASALLMHLVCCGIHSAGTSVVEEKHVS